MQDGSSDTEDNTIIVSAFCQGGILGRTPSMGNAAGERSNSYWWHLCAVYSQAL